MWPLQGCSTRAPTCCPFCCNTIVPSPEGIQKWGRLKGTAWNGKCRGNTPQPGTGDRHKSKISSAEYHLKTSWWPSCCDIHMIGWQACVDMDIQPNGIGNSEKLSQFVRWKYCECQVWARPVATCIIGAHVELTWNGAYYNATFPRVMVRFEDTIFFPERNIQKNMYLCRRKIDNTERKGWSFPLCY
jgi:hypothetical protein